MSANHPTKEEAQSFAVKRAEVEFHNFASFGDPERVLAHYAKQNEGRGSVLEKHLEFLGEMSPFLEIGANAGHSSYMLANRFGAQGFALDISSDSLRHGVALKEIWGLKHEPIRVAGDALHLPFKDNSLKMVMAFQMLSQFMEIESVFLEVKRVLAPGGVFFFAEEPLRRLLTLRLYRCPYYDTMKPWERTLYDWGLLGYFVRDVIGAHQEESFGIRQNHKMGLKDWHELIRKHFGAHEYQVFVPERGWGERVVKRLAIRLDQTQSEWRAARLLGGTLAAMCRKGVSPDASAAEPIDLAEPGFTRMLRCPDCSGDLVLNESRDLACASCTYRAPDESGVWNLLPSAEKSELYPGDRSDIIDFSIPGHERKLVGEWFELEGVYGNRYRWIGARASAVLKPVKTTPQRLRIRGHASEGHHRVDLRAIVNGKEAARWNLERPGLFVIETDLPDAETYAIDLEAGPLWEVPTDDRRFTVSLSMIRLIDQP
ncbi:MAG: class I SAM-dependent methyltransferase [Bryobacteraceae bacterium]